LQVCAQNLKPACQVGATWNYIYTTGGSLPVQTSLQTIRCIKDTVIGNNIASVLAADSGKAQFLPFSYLAKDDSNGLYFFSYQHFPNDLPMLTFRFRVDSNLQETYYGEENSRIIEHSNIKHVIKTKRYANLDSIDCFKALFLYSKSNIIHPKYFNLTYGTNNSYYFGTIDFSTSFDSHYLLLNCYTDSNGTTKFIQEYIGEGCDYVGLPAMIESRDLYAVFPNPCNDRCFISETINNIIKKVEVRNLVGELIYASDNITQLNRSGIETSQWLDGIYFCTFMGNHSTETQKFIVSH
jgi:hypothetical protein